MGLPRLRDDGCAQNTGSSIRGLSQHTDTVLVVCSRNRVKAGQLEMAIRE